ncbi:MAG: hypothetical protein GDA51_13040 [Ekhidna sp.]|nr:hypothetical protein [Ekhidna sp.]
MLIEFDNMPDDARLWIYQAGIVLNEENLSLVRKCTEQFLSQWQAHGQDLKSAFKIEYDRFLIISVDESFNQASGCSIDSSVRLIQTLEKELGLSFMTTDRIAFLLEGSIELFHFNKLKEKIAHRLIGPETKVFDHTVRNVSEFRRKWLVPVSQTWVNRYFK